MKGLIITLGNECSHASESFAGLEVINGHYDLDVQARLSFKAWVKVNCHESFSGQNFIYNKDMSVTLDENYRILSVFIK